MIISIPGDLANCEPRLEKQVEILFFVAVVVVNTAEEEGRPIDADSKLASEENLIKSKNINF